MDEKRGYVYFLMSENNNVIYVGVTSDLGKRVFEHRNNLVQGFTQKYNVHKLVYFEIFDRVVDAIAREKQIKAGPRAKKLALIRSMNTRFDDLYGKL